MANQPDRWNAASGSVVTRKRGLNAVDLLVVALVIVGLSLSFWMTLKRGGHGIEGWLWLGATSAQVAEQTLGGKNAEASARNKAVEQSASDESGIRSR